MLSRERNSSRRAETRGFIKYRSRKAEFVGQHCCTTNIDMACETTNAQQKFFSTSKSIESESYLNPCKTTWKCRFFQCTRKAFQIERFFACASAAVFYCFLLHLKRSAFLRLFINVLFIMWNKFYHFLCIFIHFWSRAHEAKIIANKLRQNPSLVSIYLLQGTL